MKIKLNITRQFLLFLILVSLVPILLFGSLFYQDIETKFNERINNLLILGVLVADNTYRNDLEALEISTKQAALFSLSQAFQSYLSNKNYPRLQKTVERFQENRHLDILTFYDIAQKPVFTSNSRLQIPYEAHILSEALRGKTVSHIARVMNPRDHRYHLIYFSACPIIKHDQDSEETIGVLLSGYSLSKNFSLRDLLLIFPQLDVRILVATPTDNHLLTSSSPDLKNIEKKRLRTLSPNHDYLKGRMVTDIFKENAAGKTYRSLVFPLNDMANKPIGYMAVSSQENDFLQLKHKNILYLFGFLSLAGILIVLASYAFNFSIIKPMDELARISDLVAEGDLSVRVQESAQVEQVQHMMHNFNKMLSQLEEDNLIRTTFVSTLTHDLRTPLFAQRRILDALHKLQQDDPDNQVNFSEMVDAIERGNTLLIDMVNKLLEAYQYESGRIRIYPEKVDLQELVEKCFNDLTPLALQKSITLHNTVPPRFSIYIDPEQFQRVLQNLVGNAIANIQSHKQVTVMAKHEDAVTKIQVQDNGPGISQEVLPHLFQRYFTGHSKQKIGTGLGLFICRMIVELHQGTITVESEPEQGTTFTIALPHYDREDIENG